MVTGKPIRSADATTLTYREISGKRGVGSPKKRADEIIKAAAEVFAERSYHGSSTQDIADRVGIRQASLYYYIPSKEVALEQVCLIGIGTMVEGALAVAKSEMSDAKKIEQFISMHIQAIDERLVFMRVFLRERQHLPDPGRRQVGNLARNYEKILQDIIASGIASREFRKNINPRITTLAILGACNSASVWYGKEAVTDIKTICRNIVDLFVSGLKR